MDWQRPSEPVRELIRRGATMVVNAPPGWLDQLDEAILSSPQMRVANLAPELLAASRDLVRRGLHESALRAYRIGQKRPMAALDVDRLRAHPR